MNAPARTNAQPLALSWKKAALRVGGSVIILALLFALLPLDQLWAAMGRIPALLWGLVIAIYMTLHLVGVLKWRLLINAAGAQLGLLHAVRCYYLGLFSNTFLPSVAGGDVVRAAVAMRHVRSRAALVLGSMVDRVQDVLGLAAVAGIGALLLPTALDAQSRRIFWVLLASGLVALALAMVVVRIVPVRRIPYSMRRRLVRVRTAFRALSRRPGPMAGAFLLGMLLQAMQVLLNAWLGSLVGLVAPLPVWLMVWPLAKIAATLPLTQGGIGVREAALAALFAPFGVAAVLAVAVSLVFQVVVISGGLLGGVLALAIGRVTKRRAAAVSLIHAEPPLVTRSFSESKP